MSQARALHRFMVSTVTVLVLSAGAPAFAGPDELSLTGPAILPDDITLEPSSPRPGRGVSRATADTGERCGNFLIGCEPFRPLTDVRDGDGIVRDTWYFLGAQIASLGILYVMPENFSGWSEEQKENYSLSKWNENVGDPVIDEDKFYINYILHPYWGAAYYVRARERGYDGWESFWYSTFLSSLYEFGPEALFEQPSIQDLIVTPVFGAWLGGWFMDLRDDVRQRSMSRGYISTGDAWLWGFTDPLHVLNNAIHALLGWQSQLSLMPLLNHSFTSGVPGFPNRQHPLYRSLRKHDRAEFGIRLQISF